MMRAEDGKQQSHLEWPSRRICGMASSKDELALLLDNVSVSS